MSLNLIRRLVKGSPLTAADHDGNLDKLETAIEDIELTPGPAGPAGAAGANGMNGREVQLQTSATHVQWRYAGDVTWTNLVTLASLTGPQGPAGPAGQQGAQGPAGAAGQNIELQVSATHIQWRVVGASTWTNLVSLATITGPQGATGQTGPTGATGPAGQAGADGKTVRNGSGAPAAGLGVDGDFYLDTTASRLYGPKTSGAWGSGVSLIGATGPAGAAGATGATGAAGADGKTVRSGSGAPLSGLGVDGDFYINTSANTIYGPKASGSWGSPTSLVGPQGATGATGPAGPVAGTSGQLVFNNAGAAAGAAGLVADTTTGRLTLASFLAGSAPSIPASGFTLYANASNALSWVGANGFTRTINATGITANREYTTQDKSGTLAHLDDVRELDMVTITYASTIDLDMSTLTGKVGLISMTGNLELTTLNRAAKRYLALILTCDATTRNLTFPSTWVFTGNSKPATLAANKKAVLSLTFTGTSNADCIAVWSVQP